MIHYRMLLKFWLKLEYTGKPGRHFQTAKPAVTFNNRNSMEQTKVLRLSKQAAAFISQQSKASLPNETGGVIVGFVADGEAFVNYAVGPGPKAMHGPTGFTRDGEYSQHWVDIIHKQSGGRCDYIGEWHSHP